MKVKPPVWMAVLAVLLLGTLAWADQIVLKDGTIYSGKFVRGDSNSVDFRILGRVETFKVEDVAQIVFKEPALESSAVSGITKSTPPPSPPPVTAAESQGQPVSSYPSEAAPKSVAGPSNPPMTTGVRPSSEGVTGEATLPVGTPITVRTSTNIDTDRNRVGDVFEATLEQPVAWGDRTVFPRGTSVKGRIAYASESGKLTGRAQLILELTEIVANGRSYFLRTSDYTEQGVNRANRTAATVGGTAALGAIIGAIAGGGTGAAVGAASGAAVGTGVQVMTHGQVLKIPAETILEFRLQAPLTVDVP
jgi:hypothetical protein